MEVFFYGLFMDKWLLQKRGLKPTNVRKGYLEGYGLRIGKASTLAPSKNERTYGVLMTLTDPEKDALYRDLEVVNYSPHMVSVVLEDNTKVDAVCYIMPENNLLPLNPDYASDLLEVAISQRFPAPYLEHIRKMAEGS